MRKTFLMVAAAAAMLVTGFTACKSSSPEPPKPPLPKEIDIYVAGYTNSGADDAAKVWKNGKELYELADKGEAFSIFIAEKK
jgi:hypothetical protein